MFQQEKTHCKSSIKLETNRAMAKANNTEKKIISHCTDKNTPSWQLHVQN